MINRILALSLRNRLLVLLVSLFVAGYGAYVAVSMPIDVLPDLNRPTVVVMADSHAMVPEDIERRVTLPLEQMLNGATDVIRVRSGSGMGLSMIFVEFAWGSDIYRNRQIVQEKLQLARNRLPPDVEPVMAPISSIMGQVQWIGVQSRTRTTHVDELRALADWQIKLRLMSIPGVAKVVSAGGSPRQLQAIVDADKLRAHDVTLEQVAAAVRNANLNVSGGFLTIGHKAPVITVKGFVEEKQELAKAVVKPDPIRPVRVSDVARVEFGPAAVRTGEAGINGHPGVILAVFKQIDTDTVALTDRIRDELVSIQAGLPEDIVIIGDLFQQSEFIHRAVDNVLLAVRDGSVLVIIVLFLFLMKLRTMLITISAIPLSVAATALVFAAWGLSINTMTLGGIAVAIGALVDDAIVGVENVHRRLRENAAGKRLGPLLVIYRASSEVRRPILIGTLLVVVVYLPLFWLSGLEGRLFTPIGIAYVTSVLASLLVSLTLTPVLCWFLLGHDRSLETHTDTWIVRRLKRAVALLIRTSVAHSAVVLAVLLSAVIGTIVVLGGRGTQFLPPFNEGVAQINLFLPPETGLEESDRFGRRLGQALTKVKGVRHVSRRTGRAEGDEHVHGVNFSHTIVTFEPEAERTREQIVDAIRAKLAREFPGVITEVSQPLAHLLAHLLSGVKAQVAIKVFGPDLDVLRHIAADVEAAVRPVPGVVDLYTEPQVLVDQIAVKPRRDALARHGLTVHQVAELVELALEGEKLSQMQLDQYLYPIVIRLEEDDRSSLDCIRGLRLRSAGGRLLRLEDVASVEVVKTPNNINRENVSRRIAVQHNVAGRSLGEVVADVQTALEPITAALASGYAIRIGGQYRAQQQAARMVYGLSGLALALMFLILYLHFRSVNLSLQVLASVPMAFVGAVLWIALSGQAVSVATLVGLIALGGIASRNGILLIDHYLHLMREEDQPFGVAMIVRAGQERMVPVVMTALTSGIALVPIALAADQPGREILYPVATVIIFGLVSSTILDFLVRPALFFALGRREAERLVSQPQAPDPSDRLMTDALEIEQGV
ncbi:MAG: efflux RND transporter permease subunit [Planctomycetota bacterium]|jgi:CzcA family heavy metal efflux pump